MIITVGFRSLVYDTSFSKNLALFNTLFYYNLIFPFFSPQVDMDPQDMEPLHMVVPPMEPLEDSQGTHPQDRGSKHQVKDGEASHRLTQRFSSGSYQLMLTAAGELQPLSYSRP